MKATTKKKPIIPFKVRPIKKVLITLDYDTNAQKVAEKGYSIAKSMKAEVLLLHVLADETYYSTLGYEPIMGFNGFSSTDFFHIINKNGLIKASTYFLEKIKKHLSDTKVKTLVKKGDFAETILKIAKNQKVDCIVMGSHSRKWLEKTLMGSVTEKVLNHTPIPLFIIPTKKHLK